MWDQYTQGLSALEKDDVIDAAVKDLETLSLAEIREQ